MGTLERTVTYKHRLGNAGRLTVKGVTGHLQVLGVDGEEARLRVVYRVRATDQATAERALEQGRVRVDLSGDSLTVETPERRLSVGIAWLFGGSRVTVDVYAEVPFATRVNLESVSGTVDGADVSGEQRYRTISGDIRLTGVGGTISASTVSGPIFTEALAGVRLNLNTVSGSVTARAPLFRDLRLSTTSGDIRVEGALTPDGSYKADSVSGALELMTPSGVTAELKTLSGRIVSEVEHRVQGGRGQWRVVVGDGAADFRFNSTSGPLRIRRPIDAGWTVPPEPAATSAATSGATSAATSTATGSTTAEGPAPADSTGNGPAASDMPDAWQPEAGDDVADGAAAEPVEPEAPRDELDVLRAVERGELTVEEASARLEKIKEASRAR